MAENDREAVVDIFNHYVEKSFAAYPEQKMPSEFFDFLLEVTQGYPAIVVKDRDAGEAVVGFGFMRAYHHIETLRRTAEIAYFIRPEYTRKGLGHSIIEHFIQEAQSCGVDSLLANISSLNEQSLSFHKKMGFEQCGRFRRVGRKFGKDFDVIWMQKLL
jgi:phosphinothricin acetyltransferase